MIEKYLSARTARTRIGHLPEIVRGVARTFVVANADNAFGRHANFVLPNIVGLVVVLVHGHPEPFLGQRIDLSQQRPGQADGIMLEVVTEAEVTQHFKKSVVTRRITNVFKIVVLAPGANAALRRGRTGIGPRVLPGKDVLELDHTRVGKQ